jgi:sec-independent protein translocase protein TatC
MSDSKDNNPESEDTEAELSESENGIDDGLNQSMSFLDHLEEFRWTVGRSILAFILGAVLVGCFIGDMTSFLQWPLERAYGNSEAARQQLVTKSPMGVFSVLIQVVFLGGLTLSLPFVLYFFGAFVAPGLNERERKILMPASFAAFLLFIVGVIFSFLVVLPLTLSFSVKLNNFFGFTLWWTATDYFSLVVWFSVALGCFFQFPLITVILVVIGVVSTAQLKLYRRFVFVGILIFAAFLTPGGDPISLSIMTLPMYALYEIAILVGARFERQRQRAIEDAWEE